jgi:hypothetical protein
MHGLMREGRNAVFLSSTLLYPGLDPWPVQPALVVAGDRALPPEAAFFAPAGAVASGGASYIDATTALSRRHPRLALACRLARDVRRKRFHAGWVNFAGPTT